MHSFLALGLVFFFWRGVGGVGRAGGSVHLCRVYLGDRHSTYVFGEFYFGDRNFCAFCGVTFRGWTL